MANPALIVPIDLAALCVGDDDAHGDPSMYGTKDFARVAADFSVLPFVDAQGVRHNEGPNISHAVLPPPFAPADPLATGIHLHWALPDALTHGTHDKTSNRIRFHAAPNRWLVVRIANSWTKPAAPATALAAWVIESDHLWDPDPNNPDQLPQNAMSRAVLLQPKLTAKDNKSTRALGRVFRLAGWNGDAGSRYLNTLPTPAGKLKPVLTALGYGLPDFAAHYEHGPNVFGFNDSLDDLDAKAFPPASSSLSYAVIGWYSNLANDPLYTFKYPDGATDAKNRMAAIADELHWAFASDGTLPDHVVCNGVMHGISWDRGRKYLQPRAKSGIDVAIGNTTAECVSALIAHRNPTLPNLETLLNCFQIGLLERIEQPGGAADADEDLHQAAYASVPGGTIWAIQPVTPGNQDATQKKNVVTTDQNILDAAARTAELNAEIAPLLNALNSAQQDYDGLAADILTRRSQIFADWYKYMLADYTTTPVDQQDAFKYIQAEIHALNAQLVTLGNRKADADNALALLKAKLPSGYTAIDMDAPRYWEANDPVVLVTGDDARPSRRYGGDGDYDKNGNLLCRLSTGLITSVAVTSGGEVAASALPGLGPLSSALPADTAGLVAEAFFLDPKRAVLLARLAGGANADTIEAAQKDLLAGNAPKGVTFRGIAPSPVGVTAWEPPWIPLLLHWEVRFTPMQPVGENAGGGNYDPDFISTNFQIDPNEIHLKPTQTPTGDYQTYQGSVVLAGNPQINLASQVDRYFKNHPDDPSAAEIEQIKDQLDFSAMAQALNGFNEQLLMRAQTLQLPVFDPLAASRHGVMRGNFCNIDVPKAVGDQNNLAALPLQEFNPIRTGSLKLVKLRLIDAFGQVRDIENPNMIVAGDLRPPSGDDSAAFLAPRIAQSSRLLFRWLSAADDAVETNSHPAATPVCGWVLFNRLDTTLMVYDVDGTALGSLNMQGPPWQSAPGSGEMTSDPEVALAQANPHLRAFVRRVLASEDRSFLEALLDVIDTQMMTINPLGFKQSQGLSLLIGQPLALVRASLRLELQGRPLLDESWPAFADVVKTQNIDSRPCANVTGVRFPVRLGDLGKLADGLVGYFIDDGGDLGPFYAAAATGDARSGVVPPRDPDTLTLTPVASSDQSGGHKLLMLTDPRGAVHATTGILPVKAISIPPDMYGKALKRLAVTFLTAPVIGGDRPLVMPLPDEAGYSWSWVTHRPGTSQWQTDPELPRSPVTGKATWPQRIEEGWLKLAQSLPPTTIEQ
jgi:hypothetical protein